MFTVGTLLLCARVRVSFWATYMFQHTQHIIITPFCPHLPVQPSMSSTESTMLNTLGFFSCFFFLPKQNPADSSVKPVPFLVGILVFLLHFEIISSWGVTWNDHTHTYVYSSYIGKKLHTELSCCSQTDSNPLKSSQHRPWWIICELHPFCCSSQYHSDD